MLTCQLKQHKGQVLTWECACYFILLGPAAKLIESQFPDQGLNPGPSAVKAWTTKGFRHTILNGLVREGLSGEVAFEQSAQ